MDVQEGFAGSSFCVSARPACRSTCLRGLLGALLLQLLLLLPFLGRTSLSNTSKLRAVRLDRVGVEGQRKGLYINRRKFESLVVRLSALSFSSVHDSGRPRGGDTRSPHKHTPATFIWDSQKMYILLSFCPSSWSLLLSYSFHL